jgi:hypothetical protein
LGIGIKLVIKKEGGSMQLTEEQEFTMKVAQKGYESYCRYTGNKSVVTGDDLPAWNDLPGEVNNAWCAAADEIIDLLAKQRLVQIAKNEM